MCEGKACKEIASLSGLERMLHMCALAQECAPEHFVLSASAAAPGAAAQGAVLTPTPSQH